MERRIDMRDSLAAHAAALELRRDDARVVEHQHIAGFEQRRQVAHLEVGEFLAWPDEKHASRIARFSGAKRNPLFGQLEIEKIDAHQ
ncbi:hypothetical protein GCM10010837_24660 [Aminobacter niigataensis]